MLALAAPFALLSAVYVIELARCLRERHGDPERRTDAAVVLGFGLLRDGSPSPVFVARIARGVELHQRGLTSRLLFTGGVGAYGRAESLVAVDVARELGLDPSLTLFEDRSHTTRENMIEAARVLREHGLADGPVAIVSDGFHLARSRRLARDAGLDPVMVAALTPAWKDRRRALRWVLREAAALVADDAMRLVGARGPRM